MRFLLAVAVVALFGAGEALAASCSSLRAQLAAAQSGEGSDALRAQYNAFGCRAGSAWGRHRACAGLERRMQGGRASAGQIRALQSQVASACANETREASRRDVRPSGSAPPPNRSRMIGGRIVLGPNEPGGSFERRGNGGKGGSEGGGGFLGNLFGRRQQSETLEARIAPRAGRGTIERLDMEEAQGHRARRTQDGEGAKSDASIAAVAGDSSGKTLREGSTQTVCVRLCDGFYFPVNDRSHPSNFYEELAMCVGRCPGADVSLYAHGSGSAIEGMRSTLTNERYADLPTAFAYRKSLSEGCGCQAQTVIAGDLSAERTLAYVGLDRGAAGGSSAPQTVASRTDVAVSTDLPPLRWRPLRAVLDETGRPLPPSLTDRTVVDGVIRQASASAGAPVALPLGREPPPPPSLPLSGPEPLRLREVGGQFFSARGDAADRSRRARRMTVITTTAVRVVPLAPGARTMTASEAAARAAAQADTPAEAPADPPAANLSDVSALPTPSGG